jgi:hypothetical protein
MIRSSATMISTTAFSPPGGSRSMRPSASCARYLSQHPDRRGSVRHQRGSASRHPWDHQHPALDSAPMYDLRARTLGDQAARVASRE